MINRSTFRYYWNCPVVILKGKVIDNDSLENIHIKGEEALTKYDKEGKKGAVEIIITD